MRIYWWYHCWLMTWWRIAWDTIYFNFCFFKYSTITLIFTCYFCLKFSNDFFKNASFSETSKLKQRIIIHRTQFGSQSKTNYYSTSSVQLNLQIITTIAKLSSLYFVIAESSSSIRTKLICESSTETISCDFGSSIFIEQARYGRFGIKAPK